MKNACVVCMGELVRHVSMKHTLIFSLIPRLNPVINQWKFITTPGNVSSTKKKSKNENKPLLKLTFRGWFFHAVFKERRNGHAKQKMPNLWQKVFRS